MLLKIAIAIALPGCVLLPREAFAQRESTRASLFRVEELMEMRLEDSGGTAKELSPAIVDRKSVV